MRMVPVHLAKWVIVSVDSGDLANEVGFIKVIVPMLWSLS